MRKVSEQNGFTIVEVIIAGVILSILCVGLLTTYSTVTQYNRGNDVRAQALVVLQREVEEFRSFRFVPGTTDARLNAKTLTTYKTGVLSKNPDGVVGTEDDGLLFNILVSIDNDPTNSVGTAVDAISEMDCRFKQITIEAVLQKPEQGWLADLRTRVEIQRVRSN